jgi:adenine-specific DNA-methyltransferase
MPALRARVFDFDRLFGFTPNTSVSGNFQSSRFFNAGKYMERFDVIYIDPPYNTGNKFSYNDKRSTNDWIDFITKRFKIAHNVLVEDGVMFISIDDSSLYELKIACDNIFGKSNFLGVFITKQAVRNNSKFINTIHEYIVAYAKEKDHLQEFKIKRLNNPAEAKMIEDITKRIKIQFKAYGKEAATKLLSKINEEYMSEKGITWLRNYSEIDESGEIFFPKDLSVPGEPADDKVLSILDFYSRQGTNDLVKIGLRDLFDTPKPVELIKYLIRIATHNKQSARILDFFAGSGTTGQAVLEINKEDKKSHSFHLVQIDEYVSKDSLAYKFCMENDIPPILDQLLIHRIKTVSHKKHFNDIIKILNTR